MLGQYRTQLQKALDPNIRRTVVDEETGEEFLLTDEELNVLMRIESGRFATPFADEEIV